LDILVRSAPPREGELGAARHEAVQKYLRNIPFSGFGYDRKVSFDFNMEMAKGEVERELRSDSPPQGPAGASIHDVREWLIADRQCKYVVNFLMGQRAEVEAKLAQDSRPRLISQLDQRTPKDR
jgi:hypothetical protein